MTATTLPRHRRTAQEVLNGSVRELLADAHRDGVHPYTALMNAMRAR